MDIRLATDGPRPGQEIEEQEEETRTVNRPEDLYLYSVGIRLYGLFGRRGVCCRVRPRTTGTGDTHNSSASTINPKHP